MAGGADRFNVLVIDSETGGQTSVITLCRHGLAVVLDISWIYLVYFKPKPIVTH